MKAIKQQVQTLRETCQAWLPTRVVDKNCQGLRPSLLNSSHILLLDFLERLSSGFVSEAELVGEVDEARKQPFLAGAAALLFPIDWPEPFGLVMIEAMACGTPVIAYRSGSVPEVVEDGITGFIVDGEEQAIKAVKEAGRLDRSRIRARFEERFEAGRMARQYEEVYRGLITCGARHA